MFLPFGWRMRRVLFSGATSLYVMRVRELLHIWGQASLWRGGFSVRQLYFRSKSARPYVKTCTCIRGFQRKWLNSTEIKISRYLNLIMKHSSNYSVSMNNHTHAKRKEEEQNMHACAVADGKFVFSPSRDHCDVRSVSHSVFVRVMIHQRKEIPRDFLL